MTYLQELVQKKISEAKKYGGLLDLSHCGLTEIPKEVFELENIQTLRLNNSFINNEEYKNRISSIPPEISNLKTLEYLQIVDNLISDIPDEILLLKNLKLLDLTNNKLKNLNKTICTLPKLEDLQLSKNPIENVPPEIIYRGIKAIKNFFKELDTFDYLYEVKLLLVGEGRVGKTTISKALTNPNHLLEDEKSTEGIRISFLDIPKRELAREDQMYMKKDNFRFNIWDFGGQEIYHTTHQFFLTKRSVYILVTESRKEDRYEDFSYWLNVIKLLGDTSPILIVLNKIDDPMKDIPIGEFKKHFSNIVDLVKVSCHPNFKHTIDDLKRQLKSIIIDKKLLPHIGTPMPKKWVDIREELEILAKTGKDYISANEYYEICSKNYIKKESADFLSEFFHDLGVILHFSKDFELKDTIFLNHEWVTKGVYSILDNKKIINGEGVFTDSDVIDIWKEGKYKDKQRELLSLMKNNKFELCFQLEQGKYLAPQLLPVDEKEYEWRTKDNNLQFEFNYEFMPKGILTRLIVKNNRDIYQGTYWRYGVLIEWENTRAIIRERYLENKITINIEGPFKKEVLAIIRKSIKEINNDMGSVSMKEMVPCNCSECKKSETPYFHEYILLRRLVQKEIKDTRCHLSLIDVKVTSLIDDVITKEKGNNTKQSPSVIYNIDKIENSVIGSDIKTKQFSQSEIKENGKSKF